jgi:hypothetical protein
MCVVSLYRNERPGVSSFSRGPIFRSLRGASLSSNVITRERRFFSIYFFHIGVSLRIRCLHVLMFFPYV